MRFSLTVLSVLILRILMAYCSYVSQNQCSQTYLGRLNSGVIKSYNYPFDYRDNLTCTYRIYMDPVVSSQTRTICFTFFRFSLETSTPFCSFDYLAIGFLLSIKYCCTGTWQYGQEDSKSPLSSLWSQNLCWMINATSSFELTFSSDNTVHSTGFYAKFKLYDSWESALLDQGRIVSSTSTSCQGDDWMCFNRRCVHRNQLCNGRDDCGDGSDESYAHARCIGNQNIFACDFANNGSEENFCGLINNGWLLSSYMQYHEVILQDHTQGLGSNFMYSSHLGSLAISPRVSLNASVSYCLSFWYYIVGNSLPLSVYITSEQAYLHPEWSRDSGGGSWMMGEVLINRLSSILVIFSSANGQNDGLGLVAIDDISLLEGSCSGVDISCNFESSLCGWSSLKQLNYKGGSLQADDQWLMESNGSLARDHSSLDGSGYYLSVELPVTNSAVKRQALLLSPPVSGKVDEPKCLHVSYVVRSSSALDCRLSIALLQSDNVLTDHIWNQSVDGIETWRQADVDFEVNGPFQIVISATKLSQGICQVFLDKLFLDNDRCVPDVDRQCQNMSSRFMCQNGVQCIPRTSVCDGVKDCDDFSDELPFANCSKIIPVEKTTGSPSFLLSSTPLTGHSPSGCDSNQFRCTDGLCLSSGKLCDGKVDCSDGVDEQNCPVDSSTSTGRTSESLPCLDAQLSCLPEQKCLLQSQLCNGLKDCSDGSDEIQCKAVRSLNSGAVGGIVAGCIICLLIIICGVFLVKRFQQKSRKPSIKSQASVDVSTVFAAPNQDQLLEHVVNIPGLQSPQLSTDWANMQVCSTEASQKKVLHTRPTSWVYRGRRLRTTLPFICGVKPQLNLLENVLESAERTQEFSRNAHLYRSLPPIPTATANMPPLVEALLEHQRRRHHRRIDSSVGFLDLSIASEHIYDEPVYPASTDSPSLLISSSHSRPRQSMTSPSSFWEARQNSRRSCDSLVSRTHQSVSGGSFNPSSSNVLCVAAVPVMPFPSLSQGSGSSQHRHQGLLMKSPGSGTSGQVLRPNIPEVPDVPISDHGSEVGWEQSVVHNPFPSSSSSSLLLSPNHLDTPVQVVPDDFGHLQARKSEWNNAVDNVQCPINSGLSGNRSLITNGALLNLDCLPNGTCV